MENGKMYFRVRDVYFWALSGAYKKCRKECLVPMKWWIKEMQEEKNGSNG